MVSGCCSCSKRATCCAPLVHMRPGSSAFRGGAGVLSVAKLTLGQEAYYEQQVARGLDDYYAGRGESPGLWAGSGSVGLGLVGVVDDGDLGTLLRGVISEAHEAAWQAALGYLEREACVVRRGHGGVLREHGEGFVAAAFRHRTSRAQDPHLHTHVIVANMARATDGEWRALDGEAILRTYRLAAGYLYEAHLRDELTRRLGLAWTEPLKGMGELARVPEETIRAFSTRRQSLVEHMQ